ncbi:hypothetical protein H4F33_03345 [Pectobacterium brasiliense]|uniref:hypothetical protein n=1 Tax=Pectobacterium brasiliense TaxID=180957 RepID=UPI0019697D71|nr:hypothetical protein [Pectobacterium brasiliense]MBN3071168.1 hypothetical protein [Pectobacterium brasiliense]MBN3167802.1 hypothetical protein [Pectobacterium brasiliense]
MNKIVIISMLSASLFLAGCAPGYVTNPVSSNGYSQKIQDAKRKDAEFAEKVKNINLETSDVGSKPSNYKKIIEDAIRDQLKDPESAKFSDMTTPRKEVMVEQSNFVYGYSLCVYVNAKNSYGGYVGKQLYWVFMRNNQVLRISNTSGAYGNIIFVGRPVNCS